jgi:hypothetical protein
MDVQTPAKDDAIIEEACKRFEQIQSADSKNRDSYRKNMRFVYTPGAQWPDDVRATRRGWDELCLEFNQLHQFVAQVVNEQLKHRPAIVVHPASGDASEEVADILQGMTREIEASSHADDVYKQAFRLAVAGGRGWWRVCSKYCDGEGFDQVLEILPIQDSNMVYASLDYLQADGSDRAFVFVTTEYSKEDFLAKWPNADPVSWDKLPAFWSGSKDSIIVADYYRRVLIPKTLVQMSDGAVGYKDEMPDPPPGVSITRQREVDTWKVEWFTIAGGERILARYDWPGDVIPVVCVPGEDIIVDGVRVYQPLVQHAHDAQSMLNFGMTQQATQLALAPLAPYVMAEGQDDGYQDMWASANKRKWPALIYRPVTFEGQLAPPPHRTEPAMISQGWAEWCQMMLQMIKSTIGVYEQNLGMKSQEVSGVAIRAKEQQGDTATFNFVNNWHMAIALTGRIIVQCIPTFYDSERIVHIVQPDESRIAVTVNQTTPDPDAMDDAQALKAIASSDIKTGRYAVVIDAGPGYLTKKEQTSEALIQFVQAFPPAAQIAGDLIVKSMDVADADVIADRLKLMLPPNIQQMEAAKKEGKPPPDPQLMGKLTEQQQHLDQAAQTMHAMQAEIEKLSNGEEAKMKAAQIDAQVKAHAQELDAQAKAAQSQMDAQFKEQQAQTDAQLAIQKAQQDGEVTLQKARIDADARLDVARIDAETKLLIAQIPPPPELQADSKEEEMAEMMGALGELKNGMMAIQTHMTAPRKIVRGPDGSVAGVDIGGVVRNVSRGTDGKVTGF